MSIYDIVWFAMKNMQDGLDACIHDCTWLCKESHTELTDVIELTADNVDIQNLQRTMWTYRAYSGQRGHTELTADNVDIQSLQQTMSE